MSNLTLDQANRIIAIALDEGAKRGLKPLCVAVLDTGGHPIALQRADEASSLRPAVAIAKAAGALSLGMSSRAISAIATERPSFFSALTGIAPSGIVPAAGGLIVEDANGAILGAVGITGDISDNDEACALAAIDAVGLLARD